MKLLLAMLAMVLSVNPCFAVLTVSNISFYSVSHTSLTVFFEVTGGTPIADSIGLASLRIRYGPTSTYNCATATGTGGKVVNAYISLSAFQLLNSAAVYGLTPNTQYCFAPEASDGTWSSGVSANQTTAAAPATVPVQPTAPTIFDTSMPSLTGYNATHAATDCSDAQTLIDAAETARATTGVKQIVYLPNKAIATGLCGPISIPQNGRVKTFSNVTSSTCTFNITSHGFSDGDAVHISGTSSFPGRYPATLTYTYWYYGSFIEGDIYYVKRTDANSFQLSTTPGGSAVPCGYVDVTADAGTDQLTVVMKREYQPGVLMDTATPIQFISSGTLPGGLSVNTDYYPLSSCSSRTARCVFQVSASNGGAAINLTSTGTGTVTIVTRGSGSIAPIESVYNIIAPESLANLPADGSRISSSDVENMIEFRQTANYSYGSEVIQAAALADHWRIVGAYVTYPPLSTPITAVDQPMRGGFVLAENSTSNIIVDRSFTDYGGYPAKAAAVPITMSGINMAVVNSEILHQEIWHPRRTMALTAVNTTSFKVTAGLNNLGASYCNMTSTTDSTLTISGSSSGVIYVYSNCTSGGTLVANLPTGITGSWSCGTGILCSTTTAASPAFPFNGDGRLTVARFGAVGVTSGSISYVALDNSQYTWANTATGQYTIPTAAFAPVMSNNPEGPQSIFGNVRGLNIENNHIQFLGIPVHVDGCGPGVIARDIQMIKNWFDIDQVGLYSSPSSNGLYYGHRQSAELKCGIRSNLSGNINTGMFSDVTGASTTYALTPIDAASITDVNVSSNMFLNGNGGVQTPYVSANYQKRDPVRNLLISNNVVTAIAGQTNGVTFDQGWFSSGASAFEGLTFTNNVQYLPRGVRGAVFWPLGNYAANVEIEQNILSYSGSGAVLNPANEECGMDTNETMLSCVVTDAGGDLIGSTNLLVPSYSDPDAGTEVVANATVSSAFPSATLVPAQGSAAANWAYIPFASPANNRFSLTSSAVCGGTCGINEPALLTALGAVSNIVLTPGFTTISVSLTAPDTRDICVQVDLGACTTLSGAAGTRTGTLTGLTPGVTYSIRILDYYDQTSSMGFSGDRITTQNVTTASTTLGVKVGGNSMFGGSSLVK